MTSAPIRVIDTHCHLYLDAFTEDLEQVLDRAIHAGVHDILLPAIHLESLEQMEALKARAERHFGGGKGADEPPKSVDPALRKPSADTGSGPKETPTDRPVRGFMGTPSAHSGLESTGIRLYMMAGIHPCDVPRDEHALASLERVLPELCARPDIIGVGETGLDYHWSTEAVSEQKRMLRLQCRVARETGKAIVLHNRESTDDLLEMIAEEQDGRLTGVWHCFNGTREQGLRAIDLGLHLGIGGVVTFKNAGVDAVVAELPLDRMLLETDAPYLAPVPRRGERNEPSFIALTLGRLAALKGLTESEVAAATTRNALRLFGLQ